MNNLVSYLPDIIIYIILGFIFIKVYRFVSIIKNPTDYKHILTESLICGFILKNIYSLIPIHINLYIDNLGMVLSTILLAYCAAKVIYSKWLTGVLEKVGIQQTPAKDFWVDVTQGEYASHITIFDREHNLIIRGKVKMIETYNDRPLIQISNYTTTTLNNDIINNLEDNSVETIIIDTSKYPEIYLSHPQ